MEEGTDISDPAGLADKQRAENFPVALRVLPVRLREHLTAVYGFARTVDDLGDDTHGVEYPAHRGVRQPDDERRQAERNDDAADGDVSVHQSR